MIFPMLVFAAILAFIVAKLEIQIEGQDGWAKNLPTYRFTNWLTKLIMGETPVTGYHVWLNTLIFVYAHFIFFMGTPWTLALELKILGVLFIGVLLEDFFWFILNPAYGIKKFSKVHVSWHKWIGFLPKMYIVYFFAGTGLLVVSKFV